MKARSLIFLSMIIALSFSLEAYGQIEGNEKDLKFSESSRSRFDEIEKNIKSELEETKDHKWAGEYYYGDGLGVNVSISLAPKSGFIFSWFGCMGVYDLNYGRVEEKDGKVFLIPELPNSRKGFQGIETDFYPVLWGERHYLIPLKRMVDFTNDVNSGFITTKTLFRSSSGSFPLRTADVEKKVSGKPGIPSEFNDYLLDKPINSKILQILESNIVDDKDYDSKTRTSLVVLNVGRKNGVKLGMKLSTFKPSRVFETAEIIEVGEIDSKAKIIQTVYKDVRSVVPSTDWELSTKSF